MNRQLTAEELSQTIASLFSVSEPIDNETDLSKYIQDSIDLGELMAVVKEEYGVSVVNVQLFKTHVRFCDVLKIFNNEL